MSTHARGSFTVKNWDEKAYSEVAKGAKLARASVANSFHGDVEAETTLEYLMVYVDDMHGRFLGLEHLTGRIGERSGTFVLQHGGTFAGTTVEGTWFVIPGSATGELTGLRGEGGFVSQHGEQSTPFTLDYDFE